MKIIQTYQAADGKLFDTVEACQKHEVDNAIVEIEYLGLYDLRQFAAGQHPQFAGKFETLLEAHARATKARALMNKDPRKTGVGTAAAEGNFFFRRT